MICKCHTFIFLDSIVKIDIQWFHLNIHWSHIGKQWSHIVVHWSHIDILWSHIDVPRSCYQYCQYDHNTKNIINIIINITTINIITIVIIFILIFIMIMTNQSTPFRHNSTSSTVYEYMSLSVISQMNEMLPYHRFGEPDHSWHYRWPW